MIGFERGTTNDCLRVIYKGEYAGTIKILVTRPGNDWFAFPCACIMETIEDSSLKMTASWNCPEEGIKCSLSLRKDGNVSAGEFCAEGTGYAIIRLILELPEEKDIYPFMPAFMYGTNEGGKSPGATYPRLKRDAGRSGRPWETDEWLVRADRSSHCFTSAIGSKLAYAIGGKDISKYPDGTITCKNGLGISVTDPARLTYFIGYINSPYTYSVLAGRNYFTKPEGFADLSPGTVCSPLFIMIRENNSMSGSASFLMRESYKQVHGRASCTLDPNEAVSDIAGALAEYSYCPEARNFLVTWDPDQRINRKSMMFNTAWAGGLQAAYPLLAAGCRLKDGRFIECACSVFDNIAANSLSGKSGLLNENYDIYRDEWNARGWWYGMLDRPGHSSYVNGQAAYFLLLASEIENGRGISHTIWQKTASEVLDKIMSLQDENGCFGSTFSETDGAVLDRDGFCGCWFIPPLAVMYRMTGDIKYLESAEKAMMYYRRSVEGYNVYGCPHDTFKSPDEEGTLAWIKASRILHEITGNVIHLKDLIAGLEYEFSWKFAYDVHNDIEPLRSMNWSSTGGSVTSVNNAHIHPMGCSVMYDILYAWRITKDSYLLSRLKDTLNWSLNSYIRYNGHYGWGRKGMINERFCYTDSLLTERFADGSPSAVWFCYHSWAAGSVLEGLASILGTMNEDEKKLLFD